MHVKSYSLHSLRHSGRTFQNLCTFELYFGSLEKLNDLNVETNRTKRISLHGLAETCKSTNFRNVALSVMVKIVVQGRRNKLRFPLNFHMTSGQ